MNFMKCKWLQGTVVLGLFQIQDNLRFENINNKIDIFEDNNCQSSFINQGKGAGGGG